MSDGYSGTPLLKKLGIKDGTRALIMAAPRSMQEITEFSGYMHCETTLTIGPRDRDYIHWFTASRHELVITIDQVCARLHPQGMLWLSWPKKASKVPTDISEDVLRAVVLPTHLVDTKVCAVNDVWSGLKFMWRKDYRVKLM